MYITYPIQLSGNPLHTCLHNFSSLYQFSLFRVSSIPSSVYSGKDKTKLVVCRNVLPTTLFPPPPPPPQKKKNQKKKPNKQTKTNKNKNKNHWGQLYITCARAHPVQLSGNPQHTRLHNFSHTVTQLKYGAVRKSTTHSPSQLQSQLKSELLQRWAQTGVPREGHWTRLPVWSS